MAAIEALPTEDQRPWAVYLRLSKAEAAEDRDKTQAERIALTNRKLDEHQAEIEAWLDDKGLPHRDDLVFRDPALSAWKRGVVRPDWDRMMNLAKAGQIGGIAIVAVDRFTRDVTTMEGLILLAETHGVQIGGPRAGQLDLTTYEGIQQARGMAMQAANESLATSFRIKGTLARKMKGGKPMGAGRSYGFEIGGTEQRPEEVAVIREVAQRMLAGEPTAHIASDLNDRGMTTSRGGPFTASNLTRMMARPRNGGHVEHDGKLVGTIPGEPILDAVTYDALTAQIASRRRGRRPTGRYVLTGLLRCTCGHTMNGATNTRTGKRIYRCPPQLGGCGRSIDAAHTEAVVDDYMVKLLSQPDNLAEISSHEQALNEARASQLSKVEEVENLLADLEVKWASGEIKQRAYDRAKEVLDKRWESEHAKLDGLAHPTVAPPIDVTADWAYIEDDEKRALITRFGVRITIKPHRPQQRRFDRARVRISR